MARRLAVLVLAVLAFPCLAACGEHARPVAAPVSPVSAKARVSPRNVVEAGLPLATLRPGVPDSAAGRQLAWVLQALAHAPTETEVASHFSNDFISQVPPPQVVALFGQVRAEMAPLKIVSVEAHASPGTLTAVVCSDKAGTLPTQSKMRILLSVAGAEPHKIQGLWLKPVIDARPATSWDDVQSELRAVAPVVGFLAAEVTGGTCVTLASIEPNRQLAIGSAFKLYLLEALATQIAAGTHQWSDSIAIDERKRSLPSGDMRKEPAGKTFPVLRFAREMISVSDNTAADHLLAFVGRPAVEDALKASGHASPMRNIPFMSTRGLFALKLLASPDERRAYVAADTRHKRALLEGYEGRDLSKVDAEQAGWKEPRDIDSIEWFASPEDLCKVMVALKSRMDAPATAAVGEVLSRNPGIPDDAGKYKYIGFKGGSEPGVFNLTWLLQRKSDGKWLLLTMGFNDAAQPIDEEKALVVATMARDFLAAQ